MQNLATDTDFHEKEYKGWSDDRPKPCCAEFWDTIVFAFTAEAPVFSDDDSSGRFELGAFDAASKPVLDAFREVDKSEVIKNIRPRQDKGLERFVFPLDPALEEQAFGIVTLVTPPIKPNTCISAKVAMHPFYGCGTDLFQKEQNIFMRKFGMSEDSFVSDLKFLQTSGTKRVPDPTLKTDMNETHPLVPTKMFIRKFYRELIEGNYGSLLHVSDDTTIDQMPRTKMRFELPQKTIAKRKVSDNPEEILAKKIEEESMAFNQERVESLFVKKFLSRMMYLRSVINYLQQEKQKYDIFRQFWFFNGVMLIIFSFLLCIQVLLILTILFDNKYGNTTMKLVTIIATVFIFQMIMLQLWINEFGSNRALQKMFIFSGEGMVRLKMLKAECFTRSASTMAVIAIVLLISVVVLISLDVARSKNPLPIMVALLIVLLGAALSKEKRRIPWSTVVCLLSSTYISMVIFNTNFIDNIVNIISVDLNHFLVNIANFLPSVLRLNSFPLLFYWIEITIIISFGIHLLMFCDVFKLIFAMFKPLSYAVAVTWVEFSYAIAITILPGSVLLRFNTNILRLLTRSEICLVMTVSFTSYNFLTAAVLQTVGISFRSYFMLAVVTLPSSIAFSKLIYPETQKSCTAGRSLFTRHPPVVSFTHLITHIFISGIAIGTKYLALNLTGLIAMVSLMNIMEYILSTLTNSQNIGSTNIASIAFWPVMWICGITDKYEALAIANMFVQRLTVNFFASSHKYGRELSLTWLEDCKKNKNMLFYGLTTANGTDLFEEYGSSRPISHHSLSIAQPFVLSDGSIGGSLYILMKMASTRRDNEMKGLMRIAMRAFCAGLMTTFFTSVVIGMSVDKNIGRVICTTELIAKKGTVHSFCDAYVDSLLHLSKKSPLSLFSTTRERQYSENLCFELFPKPHAQ